MNPKISAGSFRIVLAGTVLAAVSIGMPNAALAGCGAPPHASGVHALAAPAARLAAGSFSSKAAGKARAENDAARHHSIVGLWHAVYTFKGATAWEAFDSWYADGNEFEAADTQIGGMCQGTWDEGESRTVNLYHVGWNFTPDGLMVVGYFIETQTDTLSDDGESYDGTYVLNNFTMTGKPDPTYDQVGTVHATRLGPE